VRADEPEEAGLDPVERECFIDLFSTGVRDSDPLTIRPSFVLFVLVLGTATVCALVGGFGAGVSEMMSSTGRGFLAWATASGPAQAGRIGHATLARTKLPSTVTGRIFSLIFCCLAASARPNTTCWTLLYTRRQVLKAPDCGVGDKSCR
jgi:hypothetical protein